MLNNNEAFRVYFDLMHVRKKWLTHEKGYRAYKTRRFLDWKPDNTPAVWRLEWEHGYYYGDRSPVNPNIINGYHLMNDLIKSRKEWKFITDKTTPLFRKRMGV